MKRILLIATLLLTILPLFTNNSTAIAQNMGSEYNPNSPYNKADSRGGHYCEERCNKCDQFIECSNMDMHMEFIHPESGNDNDNINEDNWSSGNSSSSQYVYLSVISIKEVAMAFSQIGICNNDYFIDMYNHYTHYNYPDNQKEYVEIQTISMFIEQAFGNRISHISLDKAADLRYPAIAFFKTSNYSDYNGQYWIYYQVYTNFYNLSEADYIYVFKQ